MLILKKNWITFALIAFAGISNAFMDKVKSHWNISIMSKVPEDHWFYKWAGPGSWRNKWKNGDPEQGERFLFSSTVFVFTTDFWHFAQFLFLTAIMLAITLNGNYEPTTWFWWTDFIALRIVFSLVFELFFGKILHLRKK